MERIDRRTLRALALAGAVLAASLGHPGEAWAYCESAGKNLRIMTFNVACVNGPTNNNSDTFQKDDEERMRVIAGKIKREDPDVVIINEAWSEADCKTPLIEELNDKGPYTSYVYEVDDFGATPNDSGLMLFAKDRFIEFLKNVMQNAEGEKQRYLAYGSTEKANGALTEWGGGSLRDIAYLIFPDEACYHTDCYAEKGVAMVRLQGLCPYNVAFTHTNAHYDLEDEDDLNSAMLARNMQMLEARALFLQSLTEQQMRMEPVFFGGDFNIDGNRAHPTVWPDEGQPEWNEYFTPEQTNPLSSTDFYACGFEGMKHGTSCLFKAGSQNRFFTDPGFFETSPFDLGQTTNSSLADNTVGTDFNFEGSEGFRYDYILHNQPGRGADSQFLCMQHLRRGFWGEGEGDPMSDHLPLIADFGKRAPRCSPTLRFPEDPEGSDVGAPKVTSDAEFIDPDTRIQWPGSVQWYFVDYKGAMSIGTIGKVAFQVYQAKDLSRPVSSFHKSTSEWEDPSGRRAYKGDVYVFDNPPYLVKVFAAKSTDPLSADYRKHDLDANPGYTISFHRNTCTTIKDVCPLKAGMMLPSLWPALPAAPAAGEYYPDKMYFKFSASSAKDGSLPEILFRLRADATDVLSPHLADEVGLKVFPAAAYDATRPDCGPGVPPPCNTPLPVLKGFGSTGWLSLNGLHEAEVDIETASLNLPAAAGTPAEYFMRLGRDPAQITSTLMEIRYETTLTLFQPLGLVCEVQESFWGDDYIHARFDADGAVASGPYTACKNGLTSLGTFDSDNTPRDLVSKGLARSYNSKVAPTLCEEDDVDPNDYLSPNHPLNAQGWFVAPLDPKQSVGTAGQFYWGNATNRDDTDYWYSMSYKVVHEDEAKP